MTIALPANVIKQSLQDILPLKLDQPNRYLEGILILSSIDKLQMGDNSALVQGLILCQATDQESGFWLRQRYGGLCRIDADGIQRPRIPSISDLVPATERQSWQPGHFGEHGSGGYPGRQGSVDCQNAAQTS